MDYGRSLRSDNVRRRRNKAVRMFLADNLALPLVKSLGRVAWNLIQTHYIDTLKDELFVQRLAMMNASEMIQELNISLSEEMIEAIGSEDRDIRLKLLLETVSVAFEAEKRALQHGLRGPSTVWYSSHDLDVDEFADAVLGAFNLSISTDTGDNESASLHVFEHHMNEQVPILDEEISYYADTNYDTKTFMKLDRTTSKPENLDEEELVVIVASLAKQMKELDQSIAIYVKARAANPLYQEVVHATIRQDFYNGSEYTMIGFGFILPATNDQNVLYYDMKLPVPFHLVIRLIVRFQETRLLLPRESRQLLVCLAMANFDLSFYRCRAATTSSTD
ncbi:unnamed protein product [Hyaloperonospora brassicae]|uniref:Uncharacterized protein n=1 Tax=Hyaloperonospora brassicae TaxID=162125 RepID=A0AAV0T3Y6_HYABA|nr:unnamed protein product [Hyaloperonospora brassicae]